MTETTGTRVAVFGGSFDPPHVGHVLASAYLTAVAGFDRVLVIPVFAHAFDKPLSPFSVRLELCRLAFARVFGAVVSELEAGLPTPSFTVNTLRELKRAHPDWQLRLVVGTDCVLEKSRWQSFEEVVRLAPPFVLHRAGVANHPEFEANTPGPGPRPALLPELSSRQIRAWVRELPDDERRLHLEPLVGAGVLAAIERHQLYLDQ